MAEADTTSALTSHSPTSKKRKVRKGTQSCWECKRRKTRCIFAEANDTACVGCKSRRTNCVSQEFQDDAPGARGKARAFDRGRRKRTTVSSEQDMARCIHPQPIQLTASHLEASNASGHETLANALRAVWPSQHDLQVILSVHAVRLNHIHGIFSMQENNLKDIPSLEDTLQLPPPGSHPVLVAHKLLILGLYLQSMPSNTVPFEYMMVKPRDLMSLLVETATRFVTSNDDLVTSVEGILAILTESMYQNNAGNLRRAHLSTRRAMTIGQMLGLHKSISPWSRSIIAPSIQSCINPSYLWFRVVQSDRYLSMMLGLPQGSNSNPFATPHILSTCTPLERMERQTCVAGGLILELRSYPSTDPKTSISRTREIDNLLQTAASCMPPQWWLIPDLNPKTTTDTDAMRCEKIDSLMRQLTHHHMLAQLHAPYLLFRPHHSISIQQYNDSKITALHSSRKILARFLAFKNFQPGGSYCRGVDFLAFIASTTLCVAYIDTRRRRNSLADTTSSGPGPERQDDYGGRTGYLAHQRPSDRGLMEKTLETFEGMVRDSGDTIAGRVAKLLGRLLDMEKEVNAVNTHNTKVSSSPHDDDDDDDEIEEEMQAELECSGKIASGGNVLKIRIPYLGTIKIERVPDLPPPSPRVAEGVNDPGPGLQEGLMLAAPWMVDLESELDPNDSILQGVDTALFANLLNDPVTITQGEVDASWTTWTHE